MLLRDTAIARSPESGANNSTDDDADVDDPFWPRDVDADGRLLLLLLLLVDSNETVRDRALAYSLTAGLDELAVVVDARGETIALVKWLLG